MKLDRESEELERAYPGILARLDTEPLERLARQYRITKSALYHARDRYRRMRAASISRPADRPEPAPRSLEPIPQPALPARPVDVKDSALQIGLEQAYPGITHALSRRDDVEVAVQYGISLAAIARIREMLGVSRAEASAPVGTPSAPTRALPSRLVAAAE